MSNPAKVPDTIVPGGVIAPASAPTTVNPSLQEQMRQLFSLHDRLQERLDLIQRNVDAMAHNNQQQWATQLDFNNFVKETLVSSATGETLRERVLNTEKRLQDVIKEEHDAQEQVKTNVENLSANVENLNAFATEAQQVNLGLGGAKTAHSDAIRQIGHE